ncbi:MAG: hypothetical protein JNM80_11105 [Phycisphaerae bacterium]|nr:hypothetical protein [Phycisphaerae bacterium]
MASDFVRLSAVVAACGGACAASRAQELATYTMTWHEVLAGTNQPVGAPNGLIELGEGIRVVLKVAFSPPVGSTIAYTPPPPPGVGTVAGLGSIFIDILATNASAGAWSNITRNAAANPGGIPGGYNWSLGGQGTPQPDGSLLAIGAGQFVLPGTTAVSHNPVENIWRGTWTPTTYTPRLVGFAPAAAASGPTTHSSLLIQYDVNPAGEPQYVAKFVPGAFSGTGNIQIVPAPASGAVLAAIMAAGAIRRRRK